MVVFSLESYESTPDQNGYTHWVYLDPLSRKKGLDSKLYTGRIKSSDWIADDRNGGIINGYFPRKEIADAKKWAEMQVCIASIVDRAASSFNENIGKVKRTAKRVTFASDCHAKSEQMSRSRSSRDEMIASCMKIRVQIPQIAELGSETVLDGSRHEGEYFVFDDKLPHSKMFICASKSAYNQSYTHSFTFTRMIRWAFSHEYFMYDEQNHLNEHIQQQFVGKVFYEISMPLDGRQRDAPPVDLSAFVHYFFNLYGGKMAVDGLMGIYDKDSGYTLTQPIIHSIDGRFGPRDHGKGGIHLVITNHQCTKLCRRYPNMTQQFYRALEDMAS